jgi:Mor family transcriptional regulator
MSLGVKWGINASKIAVLSKTKDSYCDNESIALVREKCGSNVAELLLLHFHGKTIYTPVEGLWMLRKKYVHAVFNGSNTVKIAIDLGVTDRWVRKIIAEKYTKNHLQTSLFN